MLDTALSVMPMPLEPAIVVNPARRRKLLAALGLLLVGLFALWSWWDWNWFKGMIERRVEAATGRRFEIVGDLDIDPGWSTTTVRADEVRFGNAAWAKAPSMAQADALAFEIEVWPLLRGDFVLPEVRLQRPRVALERVTEQPGNWMLNRPRRRDRRFEIGELLVTDGELTLRDAPARTNLTLEVKSGKPGPDDVSAPLQVSGSGRYRAQRFKLEGRVESPLELRDQTEPFRVDLRAHAGATRVHARGGVSTIAALREFDLAFALNGADLADLEPLFDIVMPTTPPYVLDGQLQRRGEVWHYREVTGRVGDSDLAGDVTLTWGGERPHLKAALVSKRLDFDDLAGFVGAPPSAGKGETTSPEQARAAAELARSARVLPQKPYRLDKLRAMDADVTLRAAQVDAAPLPLQSLQGHLLLDNGVARLDPLELGVAGGRIDSRITLDASRTPIAASADLNLRGLQLPKLFPGVELTEDSSGRIGGRVKLSGRGNSVADMLAGANGDVGLVMGKGRISNLLVEFAGLDVAEALKFLIGKDRIIPVRCAFADFGVKDGVVTARSFVFDSTDTVIYGEGRIDLRDESLNLLLRPQPKDKSLVSLRSPLVVDGSLKDPDIHPKAGPLALRAIAAAVLYSIAPPAALLALLETGPGDDADCRGKTGT